ncbi:hypothetical protein [Mesorhizobium sp. NBSH29]|uniref:hypothetical protein n=1 Tax=Mesorhizobium sp. NBSH29 TaxID=2654249 RepID=UPI00189692BE|nr:hypothetical protein [Mesorhizobium sp. NBSH29]
MAKPVLLLRDGKAGLPAAGKEPGAAIAGPHRLPSVRPLKKAEVAALTDDGARVP